MTHYSNDIAKVSIVKGNTTTIIIPLQQLNITSEGKTVTKIQGALLLSKR